METGPGIERENEEERTGGTEAIRELMGSGDACQRNIPMDGRYQVYTHTHTHNVHLEPA